MAQRGTDLTFGLSEHVWEGWYARDWLRRSSPEQRGGTQPSEDSRAARKRPCNVTARHAQHGVNHSDAHLLEDRGQRGGRRFVLEAHAILAPGGFGDGGDGPDSCGSHRLACSRSDGRESRLRARNYTPWQGDRALRAITHDRSIVRPDSRREYGRSRRRFPGFRPRNHTLGMQLRRIFRRNPVALFAVSGSRCGQLNPVARRAFWPTVFALVFTY